MLCRLWKFVFKKQEDNENYETLNYLRLIWELLYVKFDMTKRDYLYISFVIVFVTFNLAAIFITAFNTADLFEKFEVLSYTLWYGEFLMIFLSFLVQHKAYLESAQKLQAYYEEHNNNDFDRETLMNCQTKADNYVRVLKYMPIGITVGLTTPDMLIYVFQLAAYGEGTLNLPIKVTYPWHFNQEIDSLLSFASEVILMIYITQMIIIKFATPIYFFLFTVSLFKISQKRFKEVSTCSPEHLNEHLVRAVKSHQEALDFLDDVKRMGNKQYFIKFAAASVELSLSSWLLSRDSDYKSISAHCMSHFGLLALVFLLCFFGQQVINETENLVHEIYNVSWYERPAYVRRTLSLCLLRAQNTKPIKGWKFTDVSLATFYTVVTTSYTYFTFLKTMS